MPKLYNRTKTQRFRFSEFNGDTAIYRLVIRKEGKEVMLPEPFYVNALDYEKLKRANEIEVKTDIYVKAVGD